MEKPKGHLSPIPFFRYPAWKPGCLRHCWKSLPSSHEDPLQHRNRVCPLRRHPCCLRQDRRYDRIARITPLTPSIIKTEQGYRKALAHLESLMDAESGSSRESELELWSLLVERYEETHFPIDSPDPVDAIKFRMEQEGLQQKDLEKYFPSKSRVSEVLNHKRPLSIGMIRSLHKGLRIPAEVLVRESL
jgi:HTH-type transcriptional regulator/antitoxin HigA